MLAQSIDNISANKCKCKKHPAEFGVISEWCQVLMCRDSFSFEAVRLSRCCFSGSSAAGHGESRIKPQVCNHEREEERKRITKHHVFLPKLATSFGSARRWFCSQHIAVCLSVLPRGHLHPGDCMKDFALQALQQHACCWLWSICAKWAVLGAMRCFWVISLSWNTRRRICWCAGHCSDGDGQTLHLAMRPPACCWLMQRARLGSPAGLFLAAAVGVWGLFLSITNFYVTKSKNGVMVKNCAGMLSACRQRTALLIVLLSFSRHS